jgi:uncharacterized membrane protein
MMIIAGMNPKNGQEPLAASHRCAYPLVLGLALLWTSGVFLAPVAMAHGWVSADQSLIIRSGTHRLPDLAAFILRAAYGRVCHQMPGRSLWVLGYPMTVCARCLGIYLGCVAGLLAYPFCRQRLEARPPRRRWLFLALAPAAIDFAGGYLGLFENTLASRVSTGFVAGVAAALYTSAGLIAVTGTGLAAVLIWRCYLQQLREAWRSP